MTGVKQAIIAVLIFTLVAGALLLGLAVLRGRPQDLPWTRLDLGAPIGMFTGRKLAGLTDNYARCRALLRAAGVRYTMLPAVKGDGQCGYSDGIRFDEGGSQQIDYSPANLGTSCPVAAALAVWEWNVVQPAAQRRFGARVTRIEHLGSYSCRRIYGRSAGDWSEHATADALDIAAFRLSNGERISVLEDWKKGGEKAGFLREVRTGGCKLFSTVLSPDYNAAHHDHLHFDQAERGEMGWRACR
ncbi:MAG: extensin family protein [Sphingomonas sp.]|uniref:extensin-like domain-containing protein n=1 Tax=Sphingomonas sp. TaxID=28214 RepID=UPI0025FCF626|nr:extensin family protein [Sphingomonas sp.]MBX3563686.1 extensin family protein [Sphingomonas sp.]